MEENPQNKELDIKETVSHLLSSRHITKVIYVDEDFDSRGYEANSISYIRKHHLDDGFLFASKDPEIAIQEFKQWWGNDSDESARMNRIKEWGIMRSENETEQKLSDLLNENILECVSPDAFNSLDIENVFNESNQVLILMDQDLKEYGKGFDYLKKYDNQDYIQCGLFSGKFSKDEEIEKWKDLCDYSKYIYPLSKNRVTEGESNDIVEGLRNVLWLRQISKIKSLYSELLSKAVTDTSSYLSQLDPATFDYLVMAKSGKEGCWEFETLHRIGCLKLNQLLEKDLFERSFEAFQKQTSDLRVIRQIDEETIPQVTDYAKDINQLDLYSDGEIINRFYSQIGNGDIFQVNEKLYILLCQPCNLEIREDGNRNESVFVYLVPMETLSTKALDRLKNYMKNYQISNSRIVTFKSLEYVLNYSKAFPTDIRILDLVSYNKEGKVKSEIDNDVFSQLIQPNMQLRYDILKASFEAVADENAVENEIDAVEAIAIHQGKIDNETIDKLSINRVARLKDPRAQECLQELMAYLSRPAYPMDLK
ncbi:MAG: hypothetical protein IK135_00595 [Bacteroidales bacterium]|nr:hypothetical protein [Bacteroidales bacterium]